MTKIPKTIGGKLALLRKLRGYKVEHVAKAVGKSRTYISGIENGHSLPGRELLIALAHFYEVDINHLVGNSPAAAFTAAFLPRDRELVESDDELALIRFWRKLSDSERRFLLKRIDPSRK